MGKTIAEKILSRHARRDVKAGDIAVCDCDFCFGQDGTSALIIDRFRDLGVRKPFAKDRFFMVIDHSAPSPNIGVSEIHKKMRAFARNTQVGLYDIGCGVCHQLIPQEGHVTCGDLILGADSHTCTYGAINALSTGVGSTDLAITLASGKNWFKVPESAKVVVTGKVATGVYSKDIALHIIRDFTAQGATYRSVEFYGQAIDALSVDERFTITNMGVEMGAKCAIMEADKKVLAWLSGRSKRKPAPVSADPDARYVETREYDASSIVPLVAKPHTVDNVCSVEELAGVRIDQAFVGTCTNGRLEDLAVASRILRGKKVHHDVTFIVAPASKEIYLNAIRKGIVKTLVDAGCVIVAPGCGPCVGTHNGIPADNAVVISTANRNFKGRMGNPNAFIYLASPATVAASAIAGTIQDPRTYKDRL